MGYTFRPCPSYPLANFAITATGITPAVFATPATASISAIPATLSSLSLSSLPLHPFLPLLPPVPPVPPLPHLPAPSSSHRRHLHPAAAVTSSDRRRPATDLDHQTDGGRPLTWIIRQTETSVPVAPIQAAASAASSAAVTSEAAVSSASGGGSSASSSRNEPAEASSSRERISSGRSQPAPRPQQRRRRRARPPSPDSGHTSRSHCSPWGQGEMEVTLLTLGAGGDRGNTAHPGGRGKWRSHCSPWGQGEMEVTLLTLGVRGGHTAHPAGQGMEVTLGLGGGWMSLWMFSCGSGKEVNVNLISLWIEGEGTPIFWNEKHLLLILTGHMSIMLVLQSNFTVISSIRYTIQSGLSAPVAGQDMVLA